MCLHPLCEAFWLTEDGHPPAVSLKYHPYFLNLQLFNSASGIVDLHLALPKEAVNGVTTGYAFSRGWHCESCGRVSTR